MQQQTTGFAEALSNIRNVADQIGARGFIDLSDDLRIAAVTLDAAPALYEALAEVVAASDTYDESAAADARCAAAIKSARAALRAAQED